MKDYYFIMNAGVKAGGEITHAVLEGKIVEMVPVNTDFLLR